MTPTSRAHGPSRCRPTLVALVGLLVLTGGCSGAGHSSVVATTTIAQQPTVTSVAAPSPSPPVDDTSAAVIAGYEAANRAFIDAAAIPDPAFAAVAATHTGAMLRQTTDLLRSLKADGRIIRYPPDSQYRIAVESVDTADGVSRIRFCAVDDGERVDARTGEVISQGVVTARGRAALQLESGVWKLAEQTFDSRTEGASCGA